MVPRGFGCGGLGLWLREFGGMSVPEIAHQLSLLFAMCFACSKKFALAVPTPTYLDFIPPRGIISMLYMWTLLRGEIVNGIAHGNCSNAFGKEKYYTIYPKKDKHGK